MMGFLANQISLMCGVVMFVFFMSVRLCRAGVVELSLDGTDWRVKNANVSLDVAARVPGSIYTDLVLAGKLHDPYYRFNDVDYRWVGNDSWTYYRHFEVSPEMLAHTNIQLIFQGVDTVAKVFVNGKMLGKTDNMFRRYSFSLKEYVREGTNTLQVAFQSPVIYAAEQAESYPYDVPPDCPSPEQRGECHFNFIRKEACSFSWDWGPAFPTMGIWKPVFIRAYSTAAIASVTLSTRKDDNWAVHGSVLFTLAEPNGTYRGRLTVEIQNLTSYYTEITVNNSTKKHHFFICIDKKVELWWPNGHGRQPLYDVSLRFEDGNRQEVDERFWRIGFRTVELVQQPIPGSEGRTFYFKINEVPIFMKGSNWIPADSFQERVTETYLRNLLGSAAEANMNMLRVWGGGVYESDAFYEIADELGIMIWQDFMYACALYPTNNDFLDNVKAEVYHQVERIMHHPSIAVWAGNNENEGGVNVYRNSPMWQQYYDDYVKLYITTIKQVVQWLDVDRPFVPSSPSNGVETQKEGWVAKNPQDQHYGDVHHYDYASDGWNWQVYPIPRFASEFGFESWCSPETLAPVSDPVRDWGQKTQFADHRQHHPGGNVQMLAELDIHLKPPTSTNRTQAFIDFIYLTQINQAMSIKTEAELYRRSQSEVTSGIGLTMGSLYWQLNDIWQGPTWASIEYGGKWKMLHYFAKKFYNQTLLSPYLDNGAVKLYYVEDKPALEQTERHRTSDGKLDSKMQLQKGVFSMEMNRDDLLQATVSVYKWSSLKPAYTQSVTFSKPNKAAGLVYHRELSQLLSAASCASRNQCFISFTLWKDAHGASNFLLLSNFTTAQGLQKANLKIVDLSQVDEYTVAFTVGSDVPAPYVWLEAWGFPGHFSDNGFILTQESFAVKFFAREPIGDLVKFKEQLNVRSLMDVYP